MVIGPTVDWLMKPPRSKGIVLSAEVMAAVDVLLRATVVTVLVVETLVWFVSSVIQ